MNYVKQNFVKNQILKAEQLNYIENGIVNNNYCIYFVKEEQDSTVIKVNNTTFEEACKFYNYGENPLRAALIWKGIQGDPNSGVIETNYATSISFWYNTDNNDPWGFLFVFEEGISGFKGSLYWKADGTITYNEW